MRTRTRTDSPVGQRLDLSWDTPSNEEKAPLQEKQLNELNPSEAKESVPAPSVPSAQNPDESAAALSNVFQESKASPQAVPAQTSMPPESENPAPDSEPESPKAIPADALPAPSDQPQETEGITLETLVAQTASDQPQESESSTAKEETAPDEASQEAKLSAPAKSNRRASAPVNIIPKDERVGEVLMRTRIAANVKIEDLSKRLNIGETVIQSLESGDYQYLERTFGGDNCVFIVMFFKSISEELGLSKNEIDALVEKLYKEIRIADPELIIEMSPSHRDEPDEVGMLGTKRPIKSVLPKLIIFALIVISLLFFFLSIVVPYVSRTRPGVQKRVDYLPLIEQPWKSPGTVQPQQIPVP